MTPQRITDRLTLRPPTGDDLASIFAIYGDPRTNQFNPAGPLVDMRQAQLLLQSWQLHWQEQGYGQWAVAVRDMPGKLIGFGGIDTRQYLDVPRLNLGYRLGVPAWGQGYATELGRAALTFAFAELALPMVYAVVRPQHRASINVLEKIGMQRAEILDDVPGEPPSLVFKGHRVDRRTY